MLALPDSTAPALRRLEVNDGWVSWASQLWPRKPAYTIEHLGLQQPVSHGCAAEAKFTQALCLLTPRDAAASAPLIITSPGERALGQGASAEAVFRNYGADEGRSWPVASLEHRGYGLSTTLDRDQTRPVYVNSDQAAHDFVRCIEALQTRFHGPIIGYGGSYTALLLIKVARLRPHLFAALVLSSPPLRLQYLADGVEPVVRQNLGADLTDELARHVGRLVPVEIGDAQWVAREFVQIVAFGCSLWSTYQPWLSRIDFAARSLSTPNFILALRAFDRLAAGGRAWAWASSRALFSAPRDAQGSDRLTGRVWAWQQVNEVGLFFHAPCLDTGEPPGQSALFCQTRAEYRAYGERLFAHPQLPVTFNYEKTLQELIVPTVCINGGRDPWLSVCATQADQSRFPRIQFFFDSDGFHVPDAQNEQLRTEVKSALQRLLNGAADGRALLVFDSAYASS